MKLIHAKPDRIEEITAMSVRAFETDVNFGGEAHDGPPGFDSVEWHEQMAREGHLYQAMIGSEPVGAAVLFPDEARKRVYVGRIFIDSVCHRKGYGLRLMECVERHFPHATEFNLDTPARNARTNAFYKKAGYSVIKEEDGFVFYQKKIPGRGPA